MATVKKGTKIAFGDEYEGTFRVCEALTDFDLKEEFASFLDASPKRRRRYDFNSTQFVDSLEANGLIQEINVNWVCFYFDSKGKPGMDQGDE